MARNKKAPGHFEQRGSSWRWRVCVGGKYHRFTIAVDKRSDAENWARAKYAELARTETRRVDGLPTGVMFDDLVKYFEKERLPRLALGTQRTYGDSLKPIKEFFRERFKTIPLDRIRASHITQYLDWRRGHRLNGEEMLSNRTLAKDRAVLHRLFELAEELEWREGNPVAKVTIENADARQYVILDDSQFDTLAAECRDPMVKLYVLLCAEAGARCESEALWIRWEDVDLEKGFLTVVSGRDGHRTKGGRSRAVPLTARLVIAMKAHFAQFRFASYDGRRPEWVFHHRQTRRHYKAGDRVQSYRHSVENAAKRAKLPAEWVMHDLRHRRVTTWLSAGKEPRPSAESGRPQ